MIGHAPHERHAREALRRYDAARNGAELGPLAVSAAEALRVLLYEPPDEDPNPEQETPCPNH
jgi:hypothetical protein